jgi:hypothetical protein
LRLNTHIGRLHYQNLFAELVPSNFGGADMLLPRKYMAAHYLSMNLGKNAQIGVFESVIFKRRDNQFEFQYLNPVIFYRTVEQTIGSPDNLLLGLNARLNFANTAQIYAQTMVDEFVFQYAVLPKSNQKGFWGNKFAGQIGLKYLNAFNINHFDLQAEMNVARPYIYSHSDSIYTNYANYNMPLAHPLGSNFGEILFSAKYRSAGRFSSEGRIFLFKNAVDPQNLNFGNDLAVTNRTYFSFLGNRMFQGISQKTILTTLDLHYQLFHNCFFDLRGGFRNLSSEKKQNSSREFWFGGGFRLNFNKWRNDF